MASGTASNQSYVENNLFGSGAPNGGAISYDLAWVVANWQSSGCDLWEEIRSTDFFWNRFTMKKALMEGARLALKLNNPASAALYNETAQAITATLLNHYNGNFVYEEQTRQKDAAVSRSCTSDSHFWMRSAPPPNLPPSLYYYCYYYYYFLTLSQFGQTICAFNNGYDEEDGLFGPLSKEVAGWISELLDLCIEAVYNLTRILGVGTIATLSTLFHDAFQINQADDAAGIPGILYGRYEGDHYAGTLVLESDVVILMWSLCLVAFSAPICYSCCSEVGKIIYLRLESILLF